MFISHAFLIQRALPLSQRAQKRREIEYERTSPSFSRVLTSHRNSLITKGQQAVSIKEETIRKKACSRLYQVEERSSNCFNTLEYSNALDRWTYLTSITRQWPKRHVHRSRAFERSRMFPLAAYPRPLLLRYPHLYIRTPKFLV